MMVRFNEILKGLFETLNLLHRWHDFELEIWRQFIIECWVGTGLDHLYDVFFNQNWCWYLRTYIICTAKQ